MIFGCGKVGYGVWPEMHLFAMVRTCGGQGTMCKKLILSFLPGDLGIRHLYPYEASPQLPDLKF